MSVLTKLLRGGGTHKSRLHDEKGNLIDFWGLTYLPHALVTTILRVGLGWRPARPWLGYRAIRRLDSLLQPDWQMVEFGSGMSTVWFCQRCSKVVSIESNEDWYAVVRKDLERRGVTNVDYQLRPVETYHLLEQYPDRHFDFILIDGVERGRCAGTAVGKVKRGGHVYLDNSDKHPLGGETRVAEATLLRAAKERDGQAEYFVDFSPTFLCVTQGLLVRL